MDASRADEGGRHEGGGRPRRSFVAAYPTDAQRRTIERVTEELARDVEAGAGRGRGGPVRWVPPSQAHLTLAFLGDVRPEALDEFARRLVPRAASRPPFAVAYGGVGAFPDVRRPRVVWLGLGSGGSEMAEWAALVREVARETGVHVDPKPFRPHLTLGRVRERATADERAHLARVLTAAPPDVGTDEDLLHEIALVTSRPTSGGHEHTVVARVRLGGADAPRP